MNEANLADGVMVAVRGFVSRNLEVVLARLKAVERAVAIAPEKGMPGQDGPKGDRGEKGEAGDKGESGQKGDVGQKGDLGEKGDPGEQGEAGLDGADGASCDDAMVEKAVRAHMAANADTYVGPQGSQGSKGDLGETGAKGDPGEAGQRGMDGKDFDPEMIRLAVAAALPALIERALGDLTDKIDTAIKALPVPKNGEKGERGDPGEPGSDGRDGLEGPPGRDALHMDVKSFIEPAKRYSRATVAVHGGGLVMASRATDPLGDVPKLADAGWQPILNGFAGPAEVVVENGGRTVTRTLLMTDGTECVEIEKRDVVIDRGVFRAEDAYEKGDHVSYGGSGWIAQRSTELGRPGLPDSGWRLSTKAGRDGKDGAKGDRGEKGDRGRDLL